MAYHIELSPRAEEDVEEIVSYIRRDTLDAANRWVLRLFEKLDGMTEFPHACSLAPEDERCQIGVRQAVFGSYRILSSIREKENVIWILSVRRAARNERR